MSKRSWNLRLKSRFQFGFLIIFFLITSAHAFSFAVFGDNRDGDETFKALIGRLNKEQGLTFAVNTGDLVPNGKEEQYLAYRKMIASLKVPVYNVLGNHDAVNGGWRLFQKYFGPLYYSFDYENSHFVILNNARRESFDSAQFEWLKKDLAQTRAAHKFVFMHKPVFDPSEIYKGYIMSGRRVTEELEKLFEQNRVDYVFAGHIHGYARAERGGVVYIVAAGAGAPLYLPRDFGGYFHYVIIDVDSRIRDRVVRVNE